MSDETVPTGLERQKAPLQPIEGLIPDKVHPGRRASTIAVFQQAEPATMGGLSALYEHVRV